jgi:preprotein translocase subunit SecB
MQLRFYFVEELAIKANLASKAAEAASQTKILEVAEDDIDTSFEHGEAEGDQFKHRIILSIKTKQTLDLPWAIVIRIHGFFDTSVTFMQRSNAQDLLCVNGGSMLYTIAREILFSATGRGPFGAAFLPTVKFAPSGDDPKDTVLPKLESTTKALT